MVVSIDELNSMRDLLTVLSLSCQDVKTEFKVDGINAFLKEIST